MAVWVAALLAALCLAGGISFLSAGRNKEKQGYKFAGMALLLGCAALSLYVAATLLLTGGIS